MESACCYIEIKFPNTNTKPTNPKVSQPKDPRPICDHHGIHLVTLPVVHHAGHLTLVVWTEEHPTRTPDILSMFPTVILTNIPVEVGEM